MQARLGKGPFFSFNRCLRASRQYGRTIKAAPLYQWKTFHFLKAFSNAIFSYIAYLGKIFYPVKLAVFYPYQFSLPLWKVLVFRNHSYNNYSRCSLLHQDIAFFIRRLVLVSGNASSRHRPGTGRVNQAMADRYTYLPSIGIAIMLAWGIPLLFQRLEIRKKILFSVRNSSSLHTGSFQRGCNAVTGKTALLSLATF